ncbi:unnamed protein product [Urochloa decumbens]|uniref:Uncharacterized protein n=1 Tax=Urochloa decumbens TaxID=240449 RepID=A0ABC8W490_9POAL
MFPENPPEVFGQESGPPPEVDDDDADVIRAPARERELREQQGRFGAGPVGLGPVHPLHRRRGGGGREHVVGPRASRRRGPVAPEAGPDDLARYLVADDVPQPVARQDEALVFLRALRHRHLRLRRHERLQVTVPDGPGHGEHAQHPGAVPEDDAPARRLDALQLVGPVRLNDAIMQRSKLKDTKRNSLRDRPCKAYFVVDGKGDGDATAGEDGAGVAGAGDDDAGGADDGDDGGGARVVALRRLLPLAAAGEAVVLAAAARGPARDLVVHPREPPFHHLFPRRLRRRRGGTGTLLAGAARLGVLVRDQLVHPVLAHPGHLAA